MKVVILAGGLGTRLEEETHLKPKPMVEIGGRPILWHIMKIYDHYGFREFVICLGYKGYVIKEFFHNYFLHNSDVTIDMRRSRIVPHTVNCEPWEVTLVDTGLHTLTGGRIKRIQPYVGDETFMLTYGDGLSDIDIRELLAHHRTHGKQATLSAVQPVGRFGAMELDEKDAVISFKEKPKGDGRWINGGFFVLEPDVFDYIDGDNVAWEEAPLENLCHADELAAHRHRGFWMCMDTLRDKRQLEAIWDSGHPPWKVWSEGKRLDCRSDARPIERTSARTFKIADLARPDTPEYQRVAADAERREFPGLVSHEAQGSNT
jgi:glucose-1-phosphate cytidylyltransferase